MYYASRCWLLCGWRLIRLAREYSGTYDDCDENNRHDECGHAQKRSPAKDPHKGGLYTSTNAQCRGPPCGGLSRPVPKRTFRQHRMQRVSAIMTSREMLR